MDEVAEDPSPTFFRCRQVGCPAYGDVVAVWWAQRGTDKWYVYTFIDKRPVQALKDKIRALTLWAPIIHPRWSGCMLVLVEDAAEPVSPADIEMCEPLRIRNRSW